MTNKRRLLNALLPLVIVFLVSIVIIMSYLLIVTNSIWNQSVSDIKEVTDQGRHAFDTYITKESELIHYLSLQYSQMRSGDEANIQTNISSLSELEQYYFVIDLDNQKMYSNHPNYVANLGGGKLDKYSSGQGCVINEPYHSDYIGALVLGCYELFHFTDGTKAVALSEHKIENIVQEFSLSFYDDEGFSNIINNDGKILIRSNNSDNNRTLKNIFDIVDLAGNPSADIQRFKNDLNDLKDGAIRFNGRDGQQYVYTYVPLTKVEGWYYVSMVPNSVIMQYTRRVLVTPQLIILSVAFCLIIIGVLVLEAWLHNKRIARREKESAFLTNFMSDLSENTKAVFIMLDVNNYSVEYVSKNTERMLGVSAKNLQTDLVALDADCDQAGRAINFELLRKVTTDDPISFDLTRVHSISGEILALNETIYRIIGNDTEHILIVIAERKRIRM